MGNNGYSKLGKEMVKKEKDMGNNGYSKLSENVVGEKRSKYILEIRVGETPNILTFINVHLFLISHFIFFI
jgi:hypothetical protein